MTTQKLLLEDFIRPEYLLDEAYSMLNIQQSADAYKQSLLDTLRHLQGIAFMMLQNPNDRSNQSTAFQKYLANLDLIKKFFEEQSPDPTLVELINTNQSAATAAINQGSEFKPLVWNKALEVESAKLPPKYTNVGSAPAPQYKGASAFYSSDAPLTDKIALDTSRRGR